MAMSSPRRHPSISTATACSRSSSSGGIPVPRVLQTEQQAWPDLSIGGPGFCRPVWSWQQDAYAFKCNLPETDGGSAMRGDIYAD